jgi:exosortase
MRSTRQALAAIALVASFVALYAGVFAALVRDWATDDNASHGLLVLPVVGWLIWQRRDVLRLESGRPHAGGLLVVVASLLLLMLGTLGAELFVTRASMAGTAAGIVVFLWGWRHLRLLAFPFAFSLLMIPPPAILFNQIALPLQLLASRMGEAGLSMFHVPVLREGNVIVLANTTLQVAEACSGIRSLISLFAFGAIYTYVTDSRAWVRAATLLATIPAAILANGARVAGTGLAAHYYGRAAAQGFFHTFSGWLVFIVAIALVLATHRLLTAMAPRRGSAAPWGSAARAA